LILRALFDELYEIGARQYQHLFTQALDFGFDDIVGTPVDDP